MINEDVGEPRPVTEELVLEMQTLHQLSQALTGTSQVDEVIDAFFQACAKLPGLDFVIFSLVDKEQQRVRAIAGFNVTEAYLKDASHPLDSPNIMAEIVRTGQTQIIAAQARRFDPENFEAESIPNRGVRVFTPIRLRQENIGLVEIGFNKNVETPVQDSQISFLRALINQTTLALDNARRYLASQEAAYREQTIHQITEKMRAAPNLEKLLETAARELGQYLEVEHTILELGIESKTYGAAAHLSRSENGQ